MLTCSGRVVVCLLLIVVMVTLCLANGCSAWSSCRLVSPVTVKDVVVETRFVSDETQVEVTMVVTGYTKRDLSANLKVLLSVSTGMLKIDLPQQTLERDVKEGEFEYRMVHVVDRPPVKSLLGKFSVIDESRDIIMCVKDIQMVF